MPYPGLLHQEPLPLRQLTAELYLCRRHSNTVLAQSLWGLGVLVCTRFEPSEYVWWVRGLILIVISPFLPPCWSFSSALGHEVSFLGGSNILQLMVFQQRDVVLEFLQEKISACPSALPSYTTLLKTNYMLND